MKIAVLSRDSTLYSTNRLKEAGEARGHEVRIVDYLRCYMNITSRKPQIFFQGKELEGFDAVIPRIGASHTFYGTAVVRQFEMLGTFTPNESQAITRSRDKLRSLQLLARAGIGLPVTGFAHSTKDIDGLLETVGGAPVVVKLLEGTQGVGVVLAETKKAAESVIAAFRQLDANILVQEYIKESGAPTSGPSSSATASWRPSSAPARPATSAPTSTAVVLPRRSASRLRSARSPCGQPARSVSTCRVSICCSPTTGRW